MGRVSFRPYNPSAMPNETKHTRDACRPQGLFDLTAESLRERFASWGEPGYRANQVLDWVYRRGASSYDVMSNVPEALRARLAAELPIYESTLAKRQDSTDGTIKLLLRWADGATSECVLIPDGQRRTACISSQVGCPVRCAFCASGLAGLERQLTTGQMVEQAMRIANLCADAGGLSNVVFMGSGEPLANYDATVHAVRTINAAWGMEVGARKITVSTVGLPVLMRRLADERMQITLAWSLHAPTDELRQRIIPWARRDRLESLVCAARYYFDRTGREVTLEYILLGGVNDGEEQARALAGIARRTRSNVNLIAYNPVPGLPFQRPDDGSVQRFRTALRLAGFHVTVRRSRGLDIDAACGQLRRGETGSACGAPLPGAA